MLEYCWTLPCPDMQSVAAITTLNRSVDTCEFPCPEDGLAHWARGMAAAAALALPDPVTTANRIQAALEAAFHRDPDVPHEECDGDPSTPTALDFEGQFHVLLRFYRVDRTDSELRRRIRDAVGVAVRGEA